MINGLITVRTTSSRLKQKCLLPFGNENSVLEHIISRCYKNDINPIVCTSTDKEDDIIEDICITKKIDFFRGHPVNKLLRWYDCSQAYKLESFHTVDADDPFFDWEEMQNSMKMLGKDYDFVAPSKYSSSGGASVGYSIKSEVLLKALALVSRDTDTEMMWYLLENINDINYISLPNSEIYNKLNFQIRLTLDYEEDYWLLNSLARILGNQSSYKDVIEFLIKNPDFYKINSFRNDEWKNSQKSKGESLQISQK
jgi:spore coat polysaccharide biosynthesis protein SpsF